MESIGDNDKVFLTYIGDKGFNYSKVGIFNHNQTIEVLGVHAKHLISSHPKLFILSTEGEVKSDTPRKERDKKKKKLLSAGKWTPRIGFIPHDPGTLTAPGTRIRVLEIAKHIPKYVISENYADLKKCDVVVFVARWSEADIELASKLKDDGVKLIFETTDPRWDKRHEDIDGQRQNISRLLKYIDLVILPTEELKKSFIRFADNKAVVIPDGIDLEKHKDTKKHKDKTSFTICWYGCCSNLCQVDDLARQSLEKLGLEYNIKLIAVYDTGRGFELAPFKNIKLEKRKWTDEATIEAILESDVVINPRYSNWKKYKSNNKTIKAYALGVPVVERGFYRNIKKYLDSTSLRQKDGRAGKTTAKRYDSKKIAKKLIDLYSSMAMSTDVIIPVLDREEETHETLKALFKNNKNINVIIIDNGSDSLDYLKDFDVRIIKNKTNPGVCASFSQGLKLAKSRYVVLMHNDLVISTKDWIKKATSFMDDNPDAGIVGQAGWKSMDVNIEYTRANLVTTIERYNCKPDGFTQVAVTDGCCNVIRNIGMDYDKNLDYFFYDFDMSMRYYSEGYDLYIMEGSSYHFADDREKATINIDKVRRTQHEINVECSKGINYIKKRWGNWFPLSV